MSTRIDSARKRWLSGGTPLPGVFDPFSAILAERASFRGVYLAGNALGLHLGTGQPFVSLGETLDVLQAIRRVCDLPVIVDAGAGFGEPAHAAQAMRRLARTGAAAVHVDDQLYPKRAGYHRGQAQLLPAAQVAQKFAALAEARAGAQTLLIARTDALRAGEPVDQAVARCKAYVAAGAEALIVLDLGPDRAHVFREALGEVPLIWIGGVEEPVPSGQALAEAGFAASLYPFMLIAPAYEAMRDALHGLSATGRPPAGKSPARALAREALDETGFETWLAFEERYSK